MNTLHLLSLWIVTIALMLCSTVTRATTVIASAPVNPVEEGGILSLHCQVRDLQDDEEVKIVRTVGGRTERLSADKDIKSEAGDRFFLAVRQMFDGTAVYFMSIMSVTREDDGSYFCKVVREGETSSVVAAVDSIQIGVMHFPDETDPLCVSSHPTSVLAGTEVTLNCSSALTKPPVSLRWSRTGTDVSLPKPRTGTTEYDRLYSVIKFRPTVADTDSIFLCQISSPMFPGRIQTCHVGPIKVLPNSNAIDIPTTKSSDSSGKGSPPKMPSDHRITSKNTPPHGDTGGDTTMECESICSTVNTPVMYWVVATIVAGALSIIFLIVGVVLMFKTCNVEHTASMEHDYAGYSPQQHDKIYVELETKRDQMYMALANKHHGNKQPNIDMTNATLFTRANTTLDNTANRLPDQSYILQ